MNTEILLDKESKEELNHNLSILEETIHSNLNGLSNLYDEIKKLTRNPQVNNLVTKIDLIRDNKVTTKKYVTELKEKANSNLEQLIALDNEASEKFGGW